MRKLRLTEVKKLAQGHTQGEWQGKCLNPDVQHQSPLPLKVSTWTGVVVTGLEKRSEGKDSREGFPDMTRWGEAEWSGMTKEILFSI